MGLARKGTSLITVDGFAYRWLVSGNDGWLDLVMELAEGHSQRIVIQMNYDVGQLTPGFVRRMILAGLAAGWTPSKRGQQIHVRLVGDRLESIND
jgi:hypothetical protein